MRLPILLSATAISLLVLSGCSEEGPVADPQSESPAAQEGTVADEENAAGNARNALQNAGEAARQAAEAARKAANEAIENAGPALERAGELAGQFKESVDGIIAQATDDLERAARALEERIEEATGEQIDLAPGNPDAMLPPAEQLRADTRAAARAGPAGVGPDYVGVWAADAASCARIDQQAVENFAVITPTTIRRHESVCNIEEAPLTDGTITVAASCIAEGTEEERQISLTMSSPGALQISSADGAATDLVRCHLPK